MSVIENKIAIETKIDQLKMGRQLLGERAHEKAEAIGKYRKMVAITIIELRNGVAFILEGKEIKDPPTTLIPKIADGICWKEKIKADETEGLYKVAIKGMDALMAELNGLQSINRYLKEQ